MDVFWIITVFLFGACVGSFLNVVIYRLPRGQSIAFPGSHCPGCGRSIRWYDNIPLLSWLALRGRCRFCKNPISPRYIIIEAVTALLAVGLYVAYFMLHVRELGGDLSDDLPPVTLFHAWPMFIAHAGLLCGLLACSVVDIELWIVPLEVTWVVSLVGLLAATAAPKHNFMPEISPTTAAVSLAAGVGLIVALILMKRGYIQQSFLDATDTPITPPGAARNGDKADRSTTGNDDKDGKKARKARKAALKARMTADQHDATADRDAADPDVEKKSPARPRAVALTSAHGVNPRLEMLRELLFLGPALLLAVAAWAVMTHVPAVRDAWGRLFDTGPNPSVVGPYLAGASASVFGYLIGGLWVWGTRILGTLAFGKEAMGMGDVHLLACVGAVCGWVVPSAAFFVAPFLGLLWAIWLFLRRNQRELPYGPWLAVASVVVMIFHDVFARVFHQYGQSLAILFTGGL